MSITLREHIKPESLELPDGPSNHIIKKRRVSPEHTARDCHALHTLFGIPQIVAVQTELQHQISARHSAQRLIASGTRQGPDDSSPQERMVKQLAALRQLIGQKADQSIEGLCLERDNTLSPANQQVLENYLLVKIGHSSLERFGVIAFDEAGQFLNCILFPEGSQNHTLPYTRQLCSMALREKARKVIIFHNHPSGDSTPSRSDIDMTVELMLCLKSIGIQILDNLIVGRSLCYFSECPTRPEGMPGLRSKPIRTGAPN